MLAFSGAIPWEVIKQVMAEMAVLISGELHPWVSQSHQRLPKAFYGEEPFEEILESPVANLRLSAKEEGGNPRDGWYYSVSAQLILAKTKATISMSQTSQSACFGDGSNYVVASDIKMIEQLRQVFRKILGPERDLSMRAGNAIYLIERAGQEDPALAKKWLEEALALGPQPFHWDTLLRLSVKLFGSTPARLVQRLQETPYDESAWQEAANTPPQGFTLAQIAAMLRRFQTTLPEAAAWYKYEDGLGPAPFRAPPAKPLFHKMYDFRFYESNLSQHSTSVGTKTVHMRWGEGPLPIMLLEQNQEIPNESLLSLAWLWGEGVDDCVIFANKKLLPTDLDLGIAVCFFGSETFQRRVKEILAWLVPFQWVFAPFDKLFTESEPRVIHLIDRGQSERAQVSQLLGLAGVTEEVSQLYEACHCAKITCEHLAVLTRIHDKLRDENSKKAPLVAHQDQARIAALAAMICLLRQQQGLAALLVQAERFLAQCGALRDNS